MKRGLSFKRVSGIVGLLKTVVAEGPAFSVRYVTCFGSFAAYFNVVILYFLSFCNFKQTKKKNIE